MPRRTSEESARKETALEALHIACQRAGRKRRPRQGKPGYEAVECAMRWWRPDWQQRSAAQQSADLVTASSWAKVRHRRPEPHADINAELLAVYTAKLVGLLLTGAGTANTAVTSATSGATAELSEMGDVGADECALRWADALPPATADAVAAELRAAIEGGEGRATTADSGGGGPSAKRPRVVRTAEVEATEPTDLGAAVSTMVHRATTTTDAIAAMGARAGDGPRYFFFAPVGHHIFPGARAWYF